MKTYIFGKDFNSSGGALTLSPSEIRDENDGSINKELSKTHPDGWTIKGKVTEDYYEWVNAFEATHPKFGKVWGDFEDKVYADSDKGFRNFYKNHEPRAWDYGDI